MVDQFNAISEKLGEDYSDELMEQMTRHRIRHIPIVEHGQLAGIVSIGDVVKRKIEEKAQEQVAKVDGGVDEEQQAASPV